MALARKAVLGALWTITSSVGSRALGVVGTVWLTHLLAPEVYGEVTIAVIVVMTAHMIFGSGLPQYVFARPETGREGAFHVSFYYFLLGLVGLGLVVLLRRPLGPVFNAPEMGKYVPGLALASYLERVAFMPERIQTRDMRFRSLAIQRTSGEIAYSVCSVSLALFGWGGNAIVVANIVRAALRVAILGFSTDRRDWLLPCKINRRVSRDVFAFGLPMTVVNLTATGSRRWDNLLFSYLFGVGPQGIYNQAYNLADVPASQIGETIGDVLVPSFVRMEPKQRPAALVRSIALLLLIVCPLSIGLAVVAQEVADAFLGASWRGVGPMLTILAVLSVLRPISWTVSAYLQVHNRPRVIMALEVTKVVLLLSAIAAFGHFGRVLLGDRAGQLLACLAVGVAFGVNAFQYLTVVRRLDGISLGPVLAAVTPPLLACAPMAGAVLAVRATLHAYTGLGPGAVLGAEVAAGALSFVPSALLVAPKVSADLLALLRNAVRKRRGDEDDVPQPAV